MKFPSDAELYDQLLGYLAAEGEIVEDGDGVVVTEFGRRTLDQPLQLRLSPSTFGTHLREMAPDAAGLYPDLVPVEAAWRLFTVHLDEAVQTARPGETELVPVRGGVVSQRPHGTRTPLPAGVEQRVALDEHHERLIRHYADRGDMSIDVQHEILVLHTLDGRAFDPSLRIRVPSEVMRRRMAAAADVAREWSVIVEQVDRLAALVDPHVEEILLTRNGVIVTSAGVEREA